MPDSQSSRLRLLVPRDYIHIIVEDVHDDYHGMWVERELGEELQVPVGKRDTLRQHLVVKECLPPLRRDLSPVPIVIVLLLSDI